MNVSINPTYYCNFRCNFCYLTEKQLSDRNILSIDKIDAMLVEILQKHTIDSIEIYGGEVGLLSFEYLNTLIDLCLSYTHNVNVVTNLSNIHLSFLRDDITLSVSFDFHAREKSDLVLNNMLRIPRTFSVNVLVTPLILEMDPFHIITVFNGIKSITDVELKPYSKNQANSFNISHKHFDDYVKKWMLLANEMNFNFINIGLLRDVISKQKNMYSDDHVYITPEGFFGVLSFDQHDQEFFLLLNSFDEYDKWCIREKTQVINNKTCAGCEFIGHCLTEHARPFIGLEDDTCDGHIGLIKWFQQSGN